MYEFPLGRDETCHRHVAALLEALSLRRPPDAIPADKFNSFDFSPNAGNMAIIRTCSPSLPDFLLLGTLTERARKNPGST